MLGPARFYVGVAALAVPVAMSLPHEPDVASAPLFNSPLAMLGELLALRLERTHPAEAAWMRRLRCHSHHHLQQNGHDQTLKAWIKYRNPHPIHTLIQRVSSTDTHTRSIPSPKGYGSGSLSWSTPFGSDPLSYGMVKVLSGNLAK